MPGSAPILEADAQFEARLRRLDDLALAEPQPREQLTERRDRALSHPHRADIVRFDQVDLDHALILVREDGGGDPPRGATPDDADATDGAGRAHCGIAARNCAWLGARATVSATLVRIFVIAPSRPARSTPSSAGFNRCGRRPKPE